MRKPAVLGLSISISKRAKAKQGDQGIKLNAKATLGAKVKYAKVSSNSKALSLKNGKVVLKKGSYKKGKTLTMKVKETLINGS